MVYDCVYVVLVYRNTLDLEQFFIHQTTPNSKVIVVNSFFDEMTECKFRKIALLNDADFISLPNRGYGFGNNRGCEFALKKYDFKQIFKVKKIFHYGIIFTERNDYGKSFIQTI